MEGINLKRLIDIVCYFNNINKKKFYSLSAKLNVLDCRIVIASILNIEFKKSILELGKFILLGIKIDFFKKSPTKFKPAIRSLLSAR